MAGGSQSVIQLDECQIKQIKNVTTHPQYIELQNQVNDLEDDFHKMEELNENLNQEFDLMNKEKTKYQHEISSIVNTMKNQKESILEMETYIT